MEDIRTSMKKYINRILILGILLTTFNSAYALITVDTVLNTSPAVGVSYRSFNTLTIGNNSDRVLDVALTYADTNLITLVEWNGVALTKSSTTINVGSTIVEHWYLFNPDIGNHLLEVTAANNTGGIDAGAVSLYNIDTNFYPLGYTAFNITPSTNIVQNAYADVPDSVGIWALNGQSGATLSPSDSDTIVLSQPTNIYGLALARSIPFTSSVQMSLTSTPQAYRGVVLVYRPTTGGGGGGGGGGGSVATSSLIVNLPAILYSSLPIIVNPVTTTTYTFTSSVTDNTKKQGGILQVSHLSSTTPTATWGGVSMTKLITNTNALNGYKTSLFYVKNPITESNIVISGITSSSTNFISATVWTNANIVESFDAKNIIAGGNSYIDLSSLTVTPLTIVGSFETPYYSSFTRLPSTNLVDYASSSIDNPNQHFDVLSRQCVGYAGFVDCPLGYSVSPYSFPYGNMVAVSLYATSSSVVTVPTGTTPIVYEICDTFDIGCYITNAFKYLFVPSSDTTSQFRNLTLASSSPFSYAYDINNVRQELFNTSTTTTLALAVPFHVNGSTTSSISLISKAQLEAVPYAGFVRQLIGWLLWFMLAELIYYQILRVHNKETT